MPELNPNELKKLVKVIENQHSFVNNDIKKTKVNKITSRDVDIIADADITEVRVGPGPSTSRYVFNKTGKTNVLYIKTFNNQLIEMDKFHFISNYSYDLNSNQKAIDNGFVLGNMLGKKLKLRSEERSLVTPRNKSGKISRRLLYELGTGNTGVFDTINITNYKPATIHISIDASMSMRGGKWYKTQEAAVAIAKAASMVNNLDVVISYRITTGSNNSTYKPVVLIAYDSKKDKISKIKNIFKHIVPSGSTPEGLCFETIFPELIRNSKNTDSYFINFSDGEPIFENSELKYWGDVAEIHTREQIKKIKDNGINVLSYFISSHPREMNRAFRNMYGDTADVIDVTNMIQLTKSINSMFV